MQEQQHQIKIYGFLQKQFMRLWHWIVHHFLSQCQYSSCINLLKKIFKMSFIYPPINAKFATLILIGLVAVGTKAKKRKT